MAEHVLSTFNVYETVTSKIIEAIERGAGTFQMPWHVARSTMFPINAATHAEYRGVNILSLWIEAEMRGYRSSFWASYKQWQDLGAQVRKGERGSLIVFYKLLKHDEPGDHEEDTNIRFVARASWVFNAGQVDGYQPEEVEPLRLFARIEEVDAFVDAVNADVRHGFSLARYRHDADAIEMPSPASFTGTDTSSPEECYYATLLHELTHWSGASHRLNREFGKRFGDDAYAMEELVAELGAAFLCAQFGVASETRPDHAAYIGHWLAVLKQDRTAIFTAARKAQEAFEYLHILPQRAGITFRQQRR